MKFRIVSQSSPIKSLTEANDFSIVHQQSNLSVESSSQVIKCTSLQGRAVICIGKILARITNSGALSALEAPATFLAEAADNYSISELADQLEGRFVLVIVEADGKAIVCADQFSKMDVFIQKTDSGVVLTSDLSLLPIEPSLAGYDQAALVHTLTYYGYCPPKRHTIYKSVRRLGVGDIATVKSGELSIETVSFKPVATAEYGDRELQQYTDLFLERLRTVGSSEGNVVYLSSGWDSTSILAGLVHVFGASKVRAVTGRMRYSARSGVCNQPEIDRAAKMAAYFGVQLDYVDFEFLEEGPEFLNEMATLLKSKQLYGMTCLTHGKLAQKTRETAAANEVVFAGEISDGAHNIGFSQYVTIFHPSFGFREYSDKMASYLFGPTFMTLFLNGEHEKDPIFNLFLSRASSAKFDEVDADASNRPMQLLTSFFLRNGRMPLWSLDNVKMLSAEGRALYTKEMQEVYLQEAAEKATPETIYSWYLHLYNSFHWQGGTVRSLQILADKNGLASDLPFWDSRLQAFLSAMPEDWGRGLDLNNTKYPLKHMLKNNIDYPYDYQKGPHAYTYDVDHSFNHIQEVMQHSKLTPAMQKVLSDRPYKQILSAEVFNLDHIDNLVGDYLEGKTMSAAALSELFPIAMLCYIGWYGKQ